MCKTKLLSSIGLAMLLGFSAFAGGQTLVDITGEFKGKSYDCKKNPMDSGVSQSFSTPASGFIRVTTIFYPQAARGLSKGGVLWSADGKNWGSETAMARHYYGGIGTNYWELRNSGKRGPGKKYTEWYVFKINSNSPIKNWQAGIFPNYDPSLDGCTGTQYPSNTRLIIEFSESGFVQPPAETPTPASTPLSVSQKIKNYTNFTAGHTWFVKLNLEKGLVDNFAFHNLSAVTLSGEFRVYGDKNDSIGPLLYRKSFQGLPQGEQTVRDINISIDSPGIYWVGIETSQNFIPYAASGSGLPRTYTNFGYYSGNYSIYFVLNMNK